MDFRPKHLPTAEVIAAMPTNPLRIITSGCMTGAVKIWNGDSLGTHPFLMELYALPNVEVQSFCPEDFAFGTPRDVPNCEGGDGFDVLNGDARIITHEGEDWTEGMVGAARTFAAEASRFRADVAILLDVSGTCGSQVIYDGHRDDKKYIRGVGIGAAALIRAGIPVIAQRDMKTLGLLRKHVEPNFEPDPSWYDHHESEWFKNYFASTT